ncbi:MAG TPA: PEP-CTERM sorting domain-containing protein [candidate division Zixibacteria bacterium]|nr:PEP-CTERM sorting domain-containing protein [candidate division Zixibacteria bacterium]
MRTIRISLFAVAALAILALSASAGVYVYNPDPVDLNGLDHHEYYQWGLSWDQTDETVYDVVLTFDNIRNWQLEDNRLFIHLLDEVPLGLNIGWDNEDGLIDYFEGQGVLIDAWQDTLSTGWDSPGQTLTYSLRDLGLLDIFLEYASSGTYGFAFDPDCHFFNDGVSVTIITDVPEPVTIALFSLGLVGVGYGVHRRRSKS